MIVVMKAGASDEELNDVIQKIESLNYRAHVMYGVERKVIGCLGDERGKAQLQSLATMAGVEKTVPILSPYKLAGRQLQEEPIVVDLSERFRVGKNSTVVIAGPCSVESEEQIIASAQAVRDAGAHAL